MMRKGHENQQGPKKMNDVWNHYSSYHLRKGAEARWRPVLSWRWPLISKQVQNAESFFLLEIQGSETTTFFTKRHLTSMTSKESVFCKEWFQVLAISVVKEGQLVSYFKKWLGSAKCAARSLSLWDIILWWASSEWDSVSPKIGLVNAV